MSADLRSLAMIVLLSVLIGCDSASEPVEQAENPKPPDSVERSDPAAQGRTPTQTEQADEVEAVAAFLRLYAIIVRGGTGVNVTELILTDSQLSDADLVHLKGLPNLKNLNLSGTNVSDAGLVHLKGLTNLQVVTLEGTKVTEEGVKELQAELPKCEIKQRPA